MHVSGGVRIDWVSDTCNMRRDHNVPLSHPSFWRHRGELIRRTRLDGGPRKGCKSTSLFPCCIWPIPNASRVSSRGPSLKYTLSTVASARNTSSADHGVYFLSVFNPPVPRYQFFYSLFCFPYFKLVNANAGLCR